MKAKNVHPLGESKCPSNLDESNLIPVDTFGGRVHVRWDNKAALTPLGQLAFFIEFMRTNGLLELWFNECPMKFTSPNAPQKRDVLGTILLSILSGHKRYSHITSIRCDTVNPPLLGMSKVVSEDAVRRAMQNNLEETAGCKWLASLLNQTYYPILSEQWILDVDTTVKSLYGKQEGAVVGYNPHKPGRPSHTYHSYMISNIRLILDVDVHSGNKTASKYTAPGIWSLLEKIPRSHWPDFIRGDIAFGTEAIMTEADNIGIPYLFKLKKTRNVKKLVEYHMKIDEWEYAGQGWEGVEAKLQLSSWQQKRRVIILRRPIKKEVVVAKKKNLYQKELELEFAELGKQIQPYEYAVLVTSLRDDVCEIAQHYRDRADCENNFDELKNQWGWSGFTTTDMKRCRVMAKMIALIYNWWALFTRFIHPNKHTEAITSRPLLLQAVGRLTNHAGQKQITISSTHGKSKYIHKRLKWMSTFFKKLYSNAEQLTYIQRWYLMLSRIFVKYLKGRVLKPPDLLLISA
jgi:hypothetical protein